MKIPRKWHNYVFYVTNLQHGDAHFVPFGIAAFLCVIYSADIAILVRALLSKDTWLVYVFPLGVIGRHFGVIVSFLGHLL